MWHINDKNIVTNSSSQKERKIYLDMAKGLSMIAIICGHLEVFTLTRFVFTFHVPLFFLLSGYFFTYRPGVLWKRIIKYIKPYLFTAVVLLLLSELKDSILVVLGREDTSIFFRDIVRYIEAALYGSGSKGKFLNYTFPIMGATWFLLALIWAILVMNLLNRRPLQRWMRSAIVLALFGVGSFSAYWTWFPLSIQAGCSALLFVYVGHEVKFRQVKVSDSKEAILITVILWSGSIWLSFSNDFMSLVRSCFPNPLSNILGACAASYLIVLFCYKLEHLRYVRIFLKTFGQHSVVVLCFHLIEMNFVPWTIIYEMIHFHYVGILLIIVGKVLWSCGAIWIVKRTKLLGYVFR